MSTIIQNNNQMSNNASSLQEQKQDLKNIEFEEFDMQKLSDGSYIELTDDNINKISETIMCVKDILKISEQTKIFKATVNIELLSKFSDGTYSTIIRDSSGHIISHAGFEQIGMLDVTPMIIFKIASIITNQYYLHNISEQLKNIKKTLDYLKRDIFQKTKSELISIKKEIDIISKDPNTKDDDFKNKLENFRKEIRDILFDYKQKLETESKIKIDSGLFTDNIKNLKEKEEEIYFYLNIIAICEFFINVINSLILSIYVKNKQNTLKQVEIIKNDIKESSLLQDCDKYYDLISNQGWKMKSTFEKEFAYYDGMNFWLKKSSYKNLKSFSRGFKDMFSFKKKNPNYKLKDALKDTAKDTVNIAGIPTYIARKIKEKRVEKIKSYQKEIEDKREKLKATIENNTRQIENFIENRELIYITDNQNKKRLFMKV